MHLPLLTTLRAAAAQTCARARALAQTLGSVLVVIVVILYVGSGVAIQLLFDELECTSQRTLEPSHSPAHGT